MENAYVDRGGKPAERSARSLRGSRHSKHQGELSELAFMYKAASLGFGVAKPYGDNERYDFILDSRERFWRVQVKSTYNLDQDCYCLGACWKSANRRLAYTPEQIDFLVGHLVPEDVWYVVPVFALASRKCLRLYPSRDSQGGLYEKYREAWYLMAPAAATCAAKHATQLHVSRLLPFVHLLSLE